MAIKTILACLTDDGNADSLMRAACTLARSHDAHLIGLYTLEALMVYPGIAVHIPVTAYEPYGASQMEHADTLKAAFERHTRAEDFASEWRLLKSESETAAERIVESARSADIVLMAATAPNGGTSEDMRLIESVIRDAGRPVIVVPPTFTADTLGRSVLIGWKDTREATRAAHDALTVLRDGDIAHILRVNDGSFDAAEHDATSTDLAAAFARHGIETTLVHKTWEQHGVAATLHKEAFEKGADMIAVGAFGHSRTYEFLLGAATRDLLRHSDLPVMFSR